MSTVTMTLRAKPRNMRGRVRKARSFSGGATSGSSSSSRRLALWAAAPLRARRGSPRSSEPTQARRDGAPQQFVVARGGHVGGVARQRETAAAGAHAAPFVGAHAEQPLERRA